jgi:AcrR family transcriptional regulator
MTGMGLRERNAARTRDEIIEAALDLFVERGYDATTMEEVALSAGVGTSTLYRYFPTKELLVTEPIALRGQMAAELAVRPEDEPLDLALGHALSALLLEPRVDMHRILQVESVVEATPGLTASLYAVFINERALLQRAIATRTGRPEDDLYCQMTAHLTTSLLEVLSGQSRAGQAADNETAARQSTEVLRGMLLQLAQDPPTLPRID